VGFELKKGGQEKKKGAINRSCSEAVKRKGKLQKSRKRGKKEIVLLRGTQRVGFWCYLPWPPEGRGKKG